MCAYVLLLLLTLQSAAPPTEAPKPPAGTNPGPAVLERYRQQLEGFRLEMEAGRKAQEVDRDTYLKGISRYRQGITDYRQLVKALDVNAGQTTARAPQAMEPIAQRNIDAIRFAIADDVRAIRAADNAATLERGVSDARNEALRQLKEPEFEALRAYVRNRFPEPSAVRAKWDADPSVKNQVATEIDSQLNVLTSAARDIAKSLTFESVPSHAKVSLRPKYSNTPRSELTRALFENVYRGLYVYEITLIGHKPVTQELDLVNSALATFTCTLVPESAHGESGCIRK